MDDNEIRETLREIGEWCVLLYETGGNVALAMKKLAETYAENKKLKLDLSGKTFSCENCNRMADELQPSTGEGGMMEKLCNNCGKNYSNLEDGICWDCWRKRITKYNVKRHKTIKSLAERIGVVERQRAVDKNYIDELQHLSPSDKLIGCSFSWKTLEGEYSGTIIDVDNYTFIVECSDGETRGVNGEKEINEANKPDQPESEDDIKILSNIRKCPKCGWKYMNEHDCEDTQPDMPDTARVMRLCGYEVIYNCGKWVCVGGGVISAGKGVIGARATTKYYPIPTEPTIDWAMQRLFDYSDRINLSSAIIFDLATEKITAEAICEAIVKHAEASNEN